MNEFELYSRILSDDFKCKNQELLYESKSGQRASIEGKGIDGYELYRFDAEEGKAFLPFFLLCDMLRQSRSRRAYRIRYWQNRHLYSK